MIVVFSLSHVDLLSSHELFVGCCNNFGAEENISNVISSPLSESGQDLTDCWLGDVTKAIGQHQQQQSVRLSLIADTTNVLTQFSHDESGFREPAQKITRDLTPLS